MKQLARTKIIQVNPQAPDLDVLAEAAAVLRAGNIIAFPTETVYGIGALSRFPHATQRVYEIKQRPEGKPLTYHVANYVFTNHLKFDERTEQVFSFLTKRFWPGPLTLIVRDQGGKSYGFRMPAHTVARILIELCGEPVVATSANLSGQRSAVSASEVLGEMDGRIDLLIDSGTCPLAQDSTVCDLTVVPYRIVRRGSSSQEVEKALREIEKTKVLKKKIILVCTGNTCRSPMAEGWLKHQISERGLQDHYEAISSGVFALRGVPPTDDAVKVLEEEGIDIRSHQAQPLTRELVGEADLVIVMVPEHERFILSAFPHLSGKVKVLHVEDPIGMPLNVYRECFDEIKQKLRNELEWLRD